MLKVEVGELSVVYMLLMVLPLCSFVELLMKFSTWSVVINIHLIVYCYDLLLLNICHFKISPLFSRNKVRSYWRRFYCTRSEAEP